MTRHNTQNEIEALPLKKVVQVALQGIRIRIWRSMVVVSSIVLAIAFLTYILCADAFVRNVAVRGSTELVDRLTRTGMLDPDKIADQRIQTYWMVGLALMISFVGIVNAMLMSVTERFREIGTMKCLGALDSFVLQLFLIESFLEGAAGTAAGVLLGTALAYMEGFGTYQAETFTLVTSPELAGMLLICLGGGVILTVLGALYPAAQAAKMRPVVALRAEL